ncbi:MAG: InlB B-repeat-containing protein [Candidatus Methanoplasma sp.]|jgi:uncharacterized repeat protein (TIGR02543 family)|nr:InlB B-repeat-containing protein [Candidatus Methanoplasma sp.]
MMIGNRKKMLVAGVMLVLLAEAAVTVAFISAVGPGGGSSGGGGEIVRPPETYVVTFEAGAGACPPASVRDGGLASEPAPPSREGHAFTGWYRDSGCSEAWDFAKDRVRGDLTLYAGWAPVATEEPAVAAARSFSVAFDSRGGTPVAPAEGILAGSAVPEPAPPSRGGYVFAGWEDGASGKIWSFGSDRAYEGLALHARWSDGYVVSFDYAGADGGCGIASAVIAPGDLYALPSPSRDGYAFAGWVGAGGDPVAQSGAWSRAGDETLRALWADGA